jgi:hypothetical protein
VVSAAERYSARVLAVLLMLACDDTPAPREPVIETTEISETRTGPASEWPAEIASLEESVAAFETQEECERALRERVPVELSESFADLGYERIFVETCVAIRAARERSTERCREIEVSALERGCLVRVASIAELPDECPSDPTRPGRDAKCIAWALRDPTLCRAARSDRAECEAVLANDVDRCGQALEEDRGRCEAAVRRYAASLAGDRHAALGRSPATARLRVSFVDIEREPIEIALPLEHGLHASRGNGCRHTIEIGELDEVARSPALSDRPATFAAELSVPAGDAPLELPLSLTGARLAIVIPGLGVADGASGATGAVTIRELVRARGGVVRASIRGELALVPGRIRVEGDIDAYLRDLEAADCE